MEGGGGIEGLTVREGDAAGLGCGRAAAGLRPWD